MIDSILKVENLVKKAEENFLILGVSVMGVIMCLQVFSRSIFGRSMTWSEELTRHVFIWTTFVGMSYGIRRWSHVHLDYFIEKAPIEIRRIIAIANDVILIIMMLILFRYGLVYVIDQMEIKSPTMGYPIGFVLLILPISCVLSIQGILTRLIMRLKTHKINGVTK